MPQNRYGAIIAEIFRRHYKPGRTKFEFGRTEIETVASALGIVLPKNKGDLLYSFRFRNRLPEEVLCTAPVDKQWVIELAGKAIYRFRLCSTDKVEPRERQLQIKIPDATPEIVAANAMGDEQALLAKVRYNRLIDIFLGFAAYSLQNHLRTFVKGMGQIEVDEVYVGVDKNGIQYVVPVQAKCGRDHIGVVQAAQDVACCSEKFASLVCRPVAVQFLADGAIAMFELTMDKTEVKIVRESHYRLVPAREIGAEDITRYRTAKSV